MQMTEVSNSAAAILSRVIQPDGLSAAAASAFLKLEFTAADQRWMHALTVKNRAGNLTAAERRELENYLRVGRLLDLLGAKARLALKKRRDDA